MLANLVAAVLREKFRNSLLSEVPDLCEFLVFRVNERISQQVPSDALEVVDQVGVVRQVIAEVREGGQVSRLLVADKLVEVVRVLLVVAVEKSLEQVDLPLRVLEEEAVHEEYLSPGEFLADLLVEGFGDLDAEPVDLDLEELSPEGRLAVLGLLEHDSRYKLI